MAGDTGQIASDAADEGDRSSPLTDAERLDAYVVLIGSTGLAFVGALVGAVLIALLTVESLRIAVGVTHGVPPTLAAIAGTCCLALMSIGWGWADRAMQRLRLVRAAACPNPDILLLRGFAGDHARPRWRGWLTARPDTFEIMLVDTLRSRPEVRLVVTAENPKETFPAAGARRVRLDADWKEEIRGLMRRSRAIIVLMNGGDGLAWELGQVRELDLLGRVAILFPPAERPQMWLAWAVLLRSVPETVEALAAAWGAACVEEHIEPADPLERLLAHHLQANEGVSKSAIAVIAHGIADGVAGLTFGDQICVWHRAPAKNARDDAAYDTVSQVVERMLRMLEDADPDRRKPPSSDD